MRERIGEIRPSQFITTFGPGAVVDLPDLSAIVAGLDLWNLKQCMPISEPRLRARLGLSRGIYSLPHPQDESKWPTLPAFRFPKFMVCPKCRRLAPQDQFVSLPSDNSLQCFHPGTSHEHEKPSRVFPVRFVSICSRGHISDIPWHSFVHAKGRNRKCQGGRLFLDEHGMTGSLEGISVRCEACESTRPLSDALDEGVLGRCEGRRPWLGPDDRELGGCTESLRFSMRGASNAYFPIVVSALSIPTSSSIVDDLLSEVESELSQGASLEDLKVIVKFKPALEGHTAEELWQAWNDRQAAIELNKGDLYFPEWQALLRGPHSDASSNFMTAEQAVPRVFRDHISRLVQLHRLREVRVLAGFTRLDPPPDLTAVLTQDEEGRPEARFVRPSSHNLGWLPGVEVRGEGIFLALDESRVQAWEKKLKPVERGTMETYDRFCADRKLENPPPFPGIRYVLLHSLAHSLMRQLSLESGYSSTALRERIYCGRQPGKEMAGLLIYTATPDSEGSLGGLVEQGETAKFGDILWRALHDAGFCSGDPLCAEHQPVDIGDINGAACHACLLAPETSCERSNRFLDRSCLVPTVSSQDLHFFGECL